MEVLLTTVDNPYNPHAEYIKWMNWDNDHGYNTLGYLARIVTSITGYYNPEIAPNEKEYYFNTAMDEILENDMNGIFARILPEDKAPLVEEKYIETTKWGTRDAE